MSTTTTVVEQLPAPSVRQLVAESVRSRHREWMQGLLAREAEFVDPRDRVLAVFDHLERECTSGRPHCDDHGDPDLVQEHLRQVEAHIAERCADAALPVHLGQALTLLVQGARVGAAVHRSAQPARTARTAAAMLLAVYEGEALF
ncbi:F-actin-capping protein subunit alpha [Curtobacterium aurantiacum]|uniref:F-actin-capping protein subunit alpha n=1 Tax=Curtobacterium aurantiacum TaxID=3236919 RepID=UPI001BDE5657|nr:F-actin-capping protein subunit alpha [Curtobacterium flaccumfaciens]MBT1675596.1 hypothetical protein [Curtobacterium flaccumfaciens pv. flaccumfaciens]MBT1680367.1 hypothetical protein [Curtobacterium flaccumfaciens pv. flaccumfaciens]